MNREKKIIDDCTGGKKKRSDWGFDKNVCGSHNTDKKHNKLNIKFGVFFFFPKIWLPCFSFVKSPPFPEINS